MLHAYIREIIRLHICLSLLLLPDQTKTCWRLNVHTVQGRARRISHPSEYTETFLIATHSAKTEEEERALKCNNKFYILGPTSPNTPFLCSLSPRATNMPFSISFLRLSSSSTSLFLSTPPVLFWNNTKEEEGGRGRRRGPFLPPPRYSFLLEAPEMLGEEGRELIWRRRKKLSLHLLHPPSFSIGREPREGRDLLLLLLLPTFAPETPMRNTDPLQAKLEQRHV